MTEDVPPTKPAPPEGPLELRRRYRFVFGPILAVLALVSILLQRDVVTFAVLMYVATVALVDPRLGERAPWSHGLPGVPDGPPADSRIPPFAYRVTSAAICVVAAVLVAADAPG
ncbi:MAG: hypothetical protein JWP31_1465, partial [Aeromicrobium sp.]|nr:hypothetical protein [Aeromicrobium sp.]